MILTNHYHMLILEYYHLFETLGDSLYLRLIKFGNRNGLRIITISVWIYRFDVFE